MAKRSDVYGINMIKFCDDEEKYIAEGLKEGVAPEKLLEWHEKKLAWLQHERMIHLVVTLMTCVALMGIWLIVYYAVVNIPEVALLMGLLMLIVIILFGFYLSHYFKLENRVQHWYRIAEKLHNMINEKEGLKLRGDTASDLIEMKDVRANK